jgi:hypothetical protein
MRDVRGGRRSSDRRWRLPALADVQVHASCCSLKLFSHPCSNRGAFDWHIEQASLFAHDAAVKADALFSCSHFLNGPAWTMNAGHERARGGGNFLRRRREAQRA